MIGTTELLLIGGIALLLFGGKKLPELMRGMGQGVRNFKEGMRGINDEAKADDPNGRDAAHASDDNAPGVGSNRPQGDGEK